jgi:hypothetical protein
MAAYTTIDDPSAFFQCTHYTGNGGSNHGIVNGGNSDLKPDILWYKCTSDAASHILYDSSREHDSGENKFLTVNTTAIDKTDAQMFESFDTDGFSLNTDTDGNGNGRTYAAWQWKVNGGTIANNTDGDLTTSVQVNQTAGCSIITYTGLDPIEPLDLGHGLGKIPEFWFIKSREIGAKQWGVYHKDTNSSPQNYYLTMHTTNAATAASTWWRNEAPTTTIIKTGEQDDVNRANSDYICYAWTSIQGFSKFGKYVGNSLDDGPFIYTGFKPALIWIKRIPQGTAYSSWGIFDNKMFAENGSHNNGDVLWINKSAAAGKRGNGSAANGTSTNIIDFLSNGFKVRDGGSDEINDPSDIYIYMAWAESPFVTSTGVPTTAK